MDVLMAALSGLLLVTGCWLFGAGLRRRPQISTGSSTPVWTRLGRRWTTLSSSGRAWLVASLGAGLVSYLISGWVIWLILTPLAMLGLPWLLADPPNRDAELLAALDRWVRGLTSSLPTGKSIRDAIRATRPQAPPLLQRSIGLLLARLDDQWPTREAFFAMADELDSADTDAVLAALALAAERGGTGATATLRALSEDIHERLRAAREIANERAKPRIVARQVTVISVVLLGGALILGNDYLTPYRTPVGSLILAGLIAAYVGSLLMLRTMAVPPPRPRLLVWHTGGRHD